MRESTFDLLVVGAGPGGYVAALRAAQLGMRVACVEKESRLGGTCLNVGCIPSKALLDSSELYRQAREGLSAHGVRTGAVELDLGAMMARKERIVQTLTRGVASLFRKRGIERLAGMARLAAPDTVQVAGTEERTLHARRVLLATGSEPTPLPGLPFDGERVVSSTEALSLTRVPGRLLVVGAGPVGLELASVWSRLGAQVTVTEYMDRILPGMDHEMSSLLQKNLERQGIAFLLSATARAAERVNDEVRVTIESKGKRTLAAADLVLLAVGRRPCTANLGIQALGVPTDGAGRIRVDESYATTVPGIYAVGDVIVGPMLAHKASEEGIAAVERMAGQPGRVTYEAIPTVVYTSPELASVGLSEEQAEERGIPVRRGSFPFRANARARCLGETEGMVKVLADARTGLLVGLHIVGPRASDLIAEGALTIESGGNAANVARSIHAHPTLSEAVREAALAAAGRALHI